jgi:hypothetical protein
MATAAGCYGFRISGVDGARSLLVDAPETWPALDIRLVTAGTDGVPERDEVGADRAALPLHGTGWMEIERAGPRITYHLPGDLRAEELVHPYLAPGAAVLARWTGRESFHAGAILGGGGAWAVLGDRESGKSSTLGRLALDGHGVLADDLVVLDGARALAGPRCIDLRPDAAAHLGAGEPLGVVGSRERWRLRLDAVPAAVPLRGWIVLEWADEVAVEPVRGSDRLMALIPHRSVRLEPPDAGALVELASLPVLAFRRPRRWDALPEAVERLVAAIG